MRLLVDILSDDAVLPWGAVHGPGRGLVYDALARYHSELGRELHEFGVGLGVRPFCAAPPRFPTAARRRGEYRVGGHGQLMVSSPLPEVLEAVAAHLTDAGRVEWGPQTFEVTRVELEHPPAFSSGSAQLRAVSPVVVKAAGSDWYLRPTDPEFAARLQTVCVRKLDALGLPSADFGLEVQWAGAPRRFSVGPGDRFAARVDVAVTGAPESLAALRDAGLGQDCPAGFGAVA